MLYERFICNVSANKLLIYLAAVKVTHCVIYHITEHFVTLTTSKFKLPLTLPERTTYTESSTDNLMLCINRKLIHSCFVRSRNNYTHLFCLLVCVEILNCLYEQEGILHAHAWILWTTMAWAHQFWWREIENSRKGTVLLKAISFVLWIPYFPTKNILYDKNRTFSTRVFHL